MFPRVLRAAPRIICRVAWCSTWSRDIALTARRRYASQPSATTTDTSTAPRTPPAQPVQDAAQPNSGDQGTGGKTTNRDRVASLLIGSVAGSIGSVCGLGGGVIAVPLLKLFTSLKQQTASVTCIPLVLFSASIGAATYQFSCGAGVVDWEGALLIGSLASVFSPVGIRIASLLPGWLVSRALGVFLLAVIPLALWDELEDFIVAPVSSAILPQSEGTAVPTAATAPAAGLLHGDPVNKVIARQSLLDEHMALAAGLGVLVGLLGGAFGVGGGVILVPVLGRLTDTKTATATSLASVIPSALVGTIVGFRKRLIVWSLTPFLIGGASVCSFLAARFASGLTNDQQKGAFVATMAILGGRLVFIAK